MKKLFVVAFVFYGVVGLFQYGHAQGLSSSLQVQTEGKQDPQFPGGESGLFRFLGKHLRYPSAAIENNIEGTVYLDFIVDSTGTIRNIKITKDIGGGCGEEAVRVIKLMGKWIPAMQDGKDVNFDFHLPVKFQLANK